MPDMTNAGVPTASTQMSGDATRMAAIRRLEREQNKPITVKPIGQTPLGTKGFGMVQRPGKESYSMTPTKPKRY